MRCDGRIDPGSGGAVFTGQPVVFIPSRTAFTSSRLSLLVRPFTVGTEIGRALAVSLPVLDGVLDAVVDLDPLLVLTLALEPEVLVVGAPTVAVVAATLSVICVEELADKLSFGDGVASLLAAQPSDAATAKTVSAEKRENLSDTNSGIRVGID
jgi:hypothetical protein